MDFTEALAPSNDRAAVLERLAKDADQLAVLQRIVDHWPDRIHASVDRSASRDVTVSAVTRSAFEHHVRQQLVDGVLRDHGPTALLFNVYCSWRAPDQGSPPRGSGLTAQQLDTYRLDTAICEARGIVIPGGA